MTYGVIVRVPAPIQAYEASHAEVMKATGGESGVGLIFHVARATEQGFEMIEVWDSKEQCEKFNQEVVGPAVARTGVDQSGPQPEVIEFDPVGVMLAGPSTGS
ncbi:MAG: hypothetical protein JWO63_120 [Frankiales bacterium]|nr:hypothetical protein [Frankiales bacterium]